MKQRQERKLGESHTTETRSRRTGCARGLVCNPDDTGELGGVFKHEGEHLGSRKNTREAPREMARRGQRPEFQSPEGTHISPTRETGGPEQGQ